MRHFSQFSRCALLLLGAALFNGTYTERALAASRPGAPRLLVVDLGANAPDDQSITQPYAGQWQGKPALLFVRQSEGARNLWLATASVAASGASTSADKKEFEWTGRNTRWTARALTQLPAPFSVQNPAFTRDGRILCTLNAPAIRVEPNVRNKPGKFRLALLNVGSSALEFLTPARDDVNSASLSPGGARVAFSVQRAGRLAVFWMNLEGGPQYQIATEARLSGWLDDNTLLYRSTRPGRGGLYRTNPLREEKGDDKAPLSARLLLANGRDAAISPDGRTICAVVATNNRNEAESESDATQLVYLASDGSGARVLKGTEGASHPAFTPDGSTIVFEDSVPSNNTDDTIVADNAARTLWAMPMLRVPPVAILTALRPASSVKNAAASAAKNEGALAVIGTAYSEENGPLQIKVEVGSGGEPKSWTTVSTRDTAAQNESLALWTPPAGANGDWTLRLTVRDAAGDWAQSLLPVTLPLFAPLDPGSMNLPPIETVAPSAALPVNPTSARNPATPPRVVTTPSVPLVAPRVVAPPVVVAPPRRPTGNSLPILPIPALPPAPTTTPSVLSPRAVYESSGINPPSASANTSGTKSNDTLQPFPVGALRAPEAGAGDYAPPPTITPVAPTKTQKTTSVVTTNPTNPARPTQAPVATPAILITGDAPTSGAGGNSNDRARLQIEGLPSTLKAGQKIEVDATVFNTGTAGWKSGDQKPVRLFYRWIDRESGARRRWAYQWLRGDVAPGANGKVSVSITAPGAGRYRLSIGLLRLLPDNANVPPASDIAAQKLWPGEFSTNNYEVTVAP